MQRGLLGIEDLPRAEIETLLARARDFQPKAGESFTRLGILKGKMIVNLFYEASTRTRVSFEIAAKCLGADAVSITASGSSVSKGESLVDTLNTLAAMRPNAIVMRHAASGAPHFLARHLPIPIINAGDGTHEHPTQALLDAFTIRERKGRLAGLKIAIAGDLLHSRVVRSNMLLLGKLGADVWITGPSSLFPRGIVAPRVRVTASIDEAVEGADVVMMLRIQLERMLGGYFPSLREYFALFGLTPARLARAKPDALVMHPGPMNRGVEIASEVADGPASVILEQVANGVAVRMAVLYLLAGGADHDTVA
jgi:aspartate carbamoyltransferase catalytic subunit